MLAPKFAFQLGILFPSIINEGKREWLASHLAENLNYIITIKTYDGSFTIFQCFINMITTYTYE